MKFSTFSILTIFIILTSCSSVSEMTSVDEDEQTDDIEINIDSDTIDSKPDISGVIPTGQTGCYNPFSLIPCSDIGGSYPPECYNDSFYITYCGQDAQYGKSDMTGRYLIEDHGGDDIVQDKYTNLQWQRVSIEKSSWDETESYCGNLSYAGKSDWRTPTAYELETIINFDKKEPSIDTNAFPDTKPGYYKTATRYVDSPSEQDWAVNFMNGSTVAEYKSGRYIKCVRGNVWKKESFFVETIKNGSIIVTDLSTDLQWTKNPQISIFWADALKYCEKLEYGGYSDWKLPDINEIKTLARLEGSFNATGFPLSSEFSRINEVLWSSTTDISTPENKWYFYVRFGGVFTKDTNKKGAALCVRRSDTSDQSCTNGDIRWTKTCTYQYKSQKQVCNDSGEWIDEGECVDDCLPGEIVNVECADDPEKMQEQICSPDRKWTDTGACHDNCDPGSVKYITCETDPVKLQKRECTTEKSWVDEGGCFSCFKGETRIEICESDNTKFQKQSCSDSKEWVNDGSCFEQNYKIIPSGQTTCYDNSAEILCGISGGSNPPQCIDAENYTPFCGQDAQYISPYPSGRYLINDTEEPTVTDNYTLLEWQVVYESSLFDQYSDAFDHCENLEYNEFNDWRLPTEEELGSLVHYGRSDPAIYTDAFPLTSSDRFFAQPSNLLTPWYAVDFGSGSINMNNGTNQPAYARCVRGTMWKEKGEFQEVSSSGGTNIFLDERTGMYIAIPAQEVQGWWEEALEYCERLEAGTYSDWRLPDIKELISLLNRENYKPASDLQDLIPDVEYWASTTSVSDPQKAWTILFAPGLVSELDKLNQGFVICVR